VQPVYGEATSMGKRVGRRRDIEAAGAVTGESRTGSFSV
jgi:hypothetical protein